MDNKLTQIDYTSVLSYVMITYLKILLIFFEKSSEHTVKEAALLKIQHTKLNCHRNDVRRAEVFFILRN